MVYKYQLGELRDGKSLTSSSWFSTDLGGRSAQPSSFGHQSGRMAFNELDPNLIPLGAAGGAAAGEVRLKFHSSGSSSNRHMYILNHSNP